MLRGTAKEGHSVQITQVADSRGNQDPVPGIMLGGKSKEEIVKEEEELFLDRNLVDVVIREDDLECIRKKELGLEKLLEAVDGSGSGMGAGWKALRF